MPPVITHLPYISHLMFSMLTNLSSLLNISSNPASQVEAGSPDWVGASLWHWSWRAGKGRSLPEKTLSHLISLMHNTIFFPEIHKCFQDCVVFLCLETAIRHQHLENLQVSLAIKSESKNLINVKIASRTIQPGNLYASAVASKQNKNENKTKQNHKENTPL